MENNKSEAAIQAKCFQWFHNSHEHLRGLLYHVPNGEYRDKITATKLKAMGVVPGIPDMVFHYNSNTYFFEFKKPKSGKASENQKKIHEKLEEQGFAVWIIEDFYRFKDVIFSLIESKPIQMSQGITRDEYFYRHKIFSYLYNLDISKEILLEDITSKETRDKFIFCVSQFISEGYDRLEGFEILFTDDYKAIYKIYLE